ncbi:MAG: Serine/threonine protein kinase PknB [Candidatus Roizmanbacteria bacterium GW2011_GWC2_37_13]|uniref:Serine/threonine protein kinase PknB n=1 Tax=Candidatus Roizmanbacteria bacterium GW2011_GWC2_37_13 TaxID=1618486 RepID=A0A0G0GHX0_9BACT|nr:MAG: Serine/threonine protein kinase PknB [Candidatus Roizmanbacteria bacterium GW2011_GWC1_37_12]KKQ25685.1 MAG: Serine/threonine protein kinase PknB [Candidatus Roizmanbacteria bacterium GW2011_GWC2_37_13]
MGIDSPELTKFNNAAPPPDFNKLPLPYDTKRIDAWEIRERIPVQMGNMTPLPIPEPDIETKYNEVSGDARYVVEGNALVGNGGMSDIYRAWDRRLGEYVAVKKMQDWFSADEDYRSSIELEAKTMTRINHPGIPEIYDFNVVTTPDGNETPIMIMQLVEGESLYDRIDDDEQASLTLDEISSIVTQTANTIDFMNKKGLTHADIKPKNILLSQPHIKIVDFGSSNWVHKMGTATSGYTAFESFSGKRDIRSDEYSLAATVYNILFNKTPPEISWGIINKKAIESNILDSNKFKYNLSIKNKKKLIEILIKGLAENPDERY